MQGRRAFATVLLALTLLGLGWVSAAASSADGGGFSQGQIELEGVTPDSGTNSFVAGGLTVTPTVEVTHPVGLALATYFDVDPAEIMCRHEEGIGFGSIAKAYFLADILAEDSVTETVEAILDQKMLGAGWGQIFQSYDLSPSSKGRNLGSVMSGRARPPLTPTLTVTWTDTPTITPTVEVTHPVGLALATYFDVDPAEIMAWHEQGIGFGNIAKAYFLVEILAGDGVTETVEGILDLKQPGSGWGQIFKSYGLSPGGKGRNLGWVMSGRGQPPITPTLTLTWTDAPTVTATSQVTHPVGLALATYFGVPYTTTMGLHQQGIGFGNIAKAYFLVDILAQDGVTETVAGILDQKVPGTGWGQIFKSYGLSPSSKGRNLGQVMSGRWVADPPGGFSSQAGDQPGTQSESPGKGKGNDKIQSAGGQGKGNDRIEPPAGQGQGNEKIQIPPGQDGDKTPPGQQEEKGNDSGKGKGGGKKK